MKIKIFLCFSFLTLINNYAYGQTMNDFEKKYDSIKNYEIRPQTLISPTFDKDGQICHAVIEPNPFSSTKNKNNDIDEVPASFNRKYFTSKRLLIPVLILDTKELREVFDELVPVKMRKGEGKTSIDCSGFGVSCAVKLQFENVFINATVILRDKARVDMSGNNGDINSFFNPTFGVIESADIVWTERTCSKD